MNPPVTHRQVAPRKPFPLSDASGRPWHERERSARRAVLREEAPIASEFTGRWKLASWSAVLAVGMLFWAAVIAGVVS